MTEPQQIVFGVSRPNKGFVIRVIHPTRGFIGYCSADHAKRSIEANQAVPLVQTRHGAVVGILVSDSFRFIRQDRRPSIPSGWDTSGVSKALRQYEVESYFKRASAPGSHTEEEWQEVLSKYGNQCVCCSVRAEDTVLGKLTKDHIDPLVAGGSDFISNIQPLCGPCNRIKGDKDIDYRSRALQAAA